MLLPGRAVAATGWTPLMVAAVRGDLQMVELLLTAGAKVDEEDSYVPGDWGRLRVRATEFPNVVDAQSRTAGFTALFYAVLSGNADIVRRLLEAGADPMHQDGKGRTAQDIVQYLPSSDDQTAMHRVFEEEMPKIMEAKKVVLSWAVHAL